LDYYNQAAELGNPMGMCGAAGMYIKGEATDKNISRAVALYESAASQGSVRALNGLGFFYFHGDGDTPANHTKALHYFLAATEQQDSDSDSWSNAGYCIEHGLGTEADPERAATFYIHAAKNFGHFGSIVAVGNMHYEGKGVPRSVKDSVYYLGVANDIGPWVGWLRRGFDQFVQGGKGGLLSFESDQAHKNFMRSSLCYIHAGELGGYEVSQSNAAYLLQRRISKHERQLYLGANLLEAVVPSTQLLLDSPNGITDSIQSSPMKKSVLSVDYSSRLLLRELALSTAQGNANSAYSIGSLLLAGKDGESDGVEPSMRVSDFRPKDAVNMVLDSLDQEYSLEKYLPSHYLSNNDEPSLAGVKNFDASKPDEDNSSRNTKAAMTWFSKASAMNSPLGSFHLGLMYHFGIGGVEPNFSRASRYYTASIKNTVNPLHPSLRLLAQATQWMVDGGRSESGVVGGGEVASASWFSRVAAEVVGWIAGKMLYDQN
jgi:TPR repeat protein